MNRYVVRLSDGSQPPVTLSISIDQRDKSSAPYSLKSPAKPDDESPVTSVAEARSAGDLIWGSEGLLVKLKGDEGLLCDVLTYRWVERGGISLLPSAIATDA